MKNLSILMLLLSILLGACSSNSGDNDDDDQSSKAPILNVINDQSILRGETVSFTVTGDDPDGLPITFSTDGSVSENGNPYSDTASLATFDTDTGAFSWDTTGVGLGEYVVEFTVMNSASLTDKQTVSISVLPAVPQLEPIGNQSVLLGDTLAFTVTAHDPSGLPIFLATDGWVGTNSNPYTETGSLASFDENTGEFSWDTTGVVPGQYYVEFSVINSAALSDFETIAINVVTMLPEIAPIDDQTVEIGDTVSFTVVGSDPDGLDVTLSTNGAVGENSNPYTETATLASFDADTGEFIWDTTDVELGVYAIQFTVTNSDLVSHSITVTITVIGLPPEMDPMDNQWVINGDTLAFTVSATDPYDVPLTYSSDGSVGSGLNPYSETSSLASFDPDIRTFTWNTSNMDVGDYFVEFTATNANEQQDAVVVQISVLDTFAGGQRLYTQNCVGSGCHRNEETNAGGMIVLCSSQATIKFATELGPGPMPVFDLNALQEDAIAHYLMNVKPDLC